LKHSLTPEEQAEIRRREAERKKVARRKNKENRDSSDQSSTVFKSPQVKGKLLKKARAALTGTTEQNVFILKTLLDEENLDESESNFNENKLAISSDTLKKVELFYLDDQISSASPAVKDSVKVTQDGTKTKVSAKYLLYSIKECHGMFCSENPESKIGLSKFKELRPKHVLSFKKIPHNVCVCQIHENLRLALQALKSSDPLLESLNTNYKMHLNFTCSEPEKSCFENSCEECKDLKKFLEKTSKIPSLYDQISWFKWVKSGDDTSGPYCNIEKVKKTETLESLLSEICIQVPQFLDHEYVKIKQESASKTMIETACTSNSNRAVICCDFAEKFKCIHQNAPQAAHYGQTPVSIFTVAIYHRGMKPMAIASNFEKQSKDCVLAYIDTVLCQLPSTVQAVDFWSDNATSQFKNQYIMESMKTFQKRHGIKVRWHFFAPMHGKSVVDGIGGSVKRHVRQKIISRNFIVNNSKDFVAAASDMKVDVKLVNTDDISRINKIISFDRIVKVSAPVKDIKKLHSFEVQEKIKGKKTTEVIVGSKTYPAE
jgi:hypothetical protein